MVVSPSDPLPGSLKHRVATKERRRRSSAPTRAFPADDAAPKLASSRSGGAVQRATGSAGAWLDTVRTRRAKQEAAEASRRAATHQAAAAKSRSVDATLHVRRPGSTARRRGGGALASGSDWSKPRGRAKTKGQTKRGAAQQQTAGQLLEESQRQQLAMQQQLGAQQLTEPDGQKKTNTWQLVSVSVAATADTADPRVARCGSGDCLRVFGERHTATNWLVRLLDLNVNVTIVSKWPDASWVWKHTMPPPPQLSMRRPILVVTITKGPYSWLRSLHRVPYEYIGKASANFSAWLRAPWLRLRDGREHWAPNAFASPVHLWNAKNRAYSQIKVPARVSLRYESLVAEPEAEVLRLASRLALPLKSARFRNVAEAKSWESRNTRRTFAEHRRFYVHELWKNEYVGDAATADLAYIGHHLDRQLMARFRYKLIRKCVAAPGATTHAPPAHASARPSSLHTPLRRIADRRALCQEEQPW